MAYKTLVIKKHQLADEVVRIKSRDSYVKVLDYLCNLESKSSMSGHEVMVIDIKDKRKRFVVEDSDIDRNELKQRRSNIKFLSNAIIKVINKHNNDSTDNFLAGFAAKGPVRPLNEYIEDEVKDIYLKIKEKI